MEIKTGAGIPPQWSQTRLDGIKSQVQRSDPHAIRQAAQAFESTFMKTVLQSMHKAQSAFSSQLFDSASMDLYQDFLDEAWSQALSQKGIGLADFLTRQWDQKSSPGTTPRQPATLNPNHRQD